MLTSYIPGRLRFRLSDPPDISLEDLNVSSWPGVKKLTPNYRSGSVLLEYDPNVLSLETIAEVVEEFDPAAAEDLYRLANGGSSYPTFESHPRPAQATKDFISLGISLISSVITGFWGPKKWHAHCGIFLAGVAVAHAWRYRHRIKPLTKWTLNDILGLPTPKPIYVDAPIEADDDLEEDEALATAAPKTEAAPKIAPKAAPAALDQPTSSAA